MEFAIYALFLIATFTLFLFSYLTKTKLFYGIGAVFLLMLSLWVLQLGLQLNTGQTTTLSGNVETIEYDYTEITFGGVNLATVLGTAGLLIGLYLIAALAMELWR